MIASRVKGRKGAERGVQSTCGQSEAGVGITKLRLSVNLGTGGFDENEELTLETNAEYSRDQ